jgi:hypothetical protein
LDLLATAGQFPNVFKLLWPKRALRNIRLRSRRRGELGKHAAAVTTLDRLVLNLLSAELAFLHQAGSPFSVLTCLRDQ